MNGEGMEKIRMHGNSPLGQKHTQLFKKKMYLMIKVHSSLPCLCLLYYPFDNSLLAFGVNIVEGNIEMMETPFGLAVNTCTLLFLWFRILNTVYSIFSKEI